MVALRVLRKPSYLALTLVLTLLLGWLYYNFSLRAAGMNTTIFTVTRSTSQFEIDMFGATHFYTSVALDILTAFLSAVLISLTVANYRARRGAVAGSVGSTTAFIVAATTFGWPSCVVPLAGTVSATLLGSALPLLGLEFKILSLLVLIVTLVFVIRRMDSGKSRLAANIS